MFWAEQLLRAYVSAVRAIQKLTQFEPDIRERCPYYKYTEEHPEIVKPDEKVLKVVQQRQRLETDLLAGKDRQWRNPDNKSKSFEMPTLGAGTAFLFNAAFIVYLISRGE